MDAMTFFVISKDEVLNSWNFFLSPLVLNT